MESPWVESNRAEAENGELLSVEESEEELDKGGTVAVNDEGIYI